MKYRRRIRRLERALADVHAMTQAPDLGDWSHSHLVCLIADVRDTARRALGRPNGDGRGRADVAHDAPAA